MNAPVEGEREPAKVVGAPDRIYLNYGDDDGSDVPHNDEATWCDDCIDDVTQEYVRADLFAALESEISALRSALDSTENYLRRGGSAFDLHVRVCKALAIPSAASIGEGGLGDAGREMK